MFKTKRILFLVAVLMYSISILSQEKNGSINTYNETFEIGDIIDKIDFNTLNSSELFQEEKSIKKNNETLEKIADSIKIKYADDMKIWSENMKFSNNRSRIFWGDVGRKQTEISLPCLCTKQNDTLTIASGFGFFGGAGAGIKINKDKFTSIFYEYSDEPYLKKNKTDSVLVKSLELNAKYQKLILDSKPKHNKLLSGHLTFVTNPYYTASSKESEFERSQAVDMHFKCLVLEYRN